MTLEELQCIPGVGLQLALNLTEAGFDTRERLQKAVADGSLARVHQIGTHRYADIAEWCGAEEDKGGRPAEEGAGPRTQSATASPVRRPPDSIEEEKPHFSNYSLGMLAKCGFQFMWRYEEGLIRPPGVALIVGTGTGKSVDANLGHKIKTGDLLEVGDVLEVAAEGVKTEWLARGVALNKDEKGIGEETVKGLAIDQAVDLAELHHREVAPGIRPVEIERPWRVDIEDCSHDLLGYIDIQEENGDIRDTKTSKKSPAKDAADTSLQLSAYALGVYVNDGKIPGKVKLDYLVKNKKPIAVMQESTRDLADLEKIVRLVHVAAEVVRKGAYMPAPADAWYCSERFCGYHSICPFGAAQKTTVGQAGFDV